MTLGLGNGESFIDGYRLDNQAVYQEVVSHPPLLKLDHLRGLDIAW